MEINREKLEALYQETYEEYNQTKLATDIGFNFIPEDFTLLQLSRIVKYLPDADPVFIDIGTGMGMAPRFVKKLGARSISVDWPTTGGYEALENVRLAGVEGYYCEVGREPIPLPEESVDVVLFADVIEHLLHSPKPVLHEISRLLKPNGVCIATTPNAARLTVRLKMLLGFSNWPHIADYYEEAFHTGHHHEYTIAEFKEVFRRAGFSEEEFILYEKTLRHTHIAGCHDLQSKERSGKKRVAKSPLLIRFGKSLLLSVTELWPPFRSQMLIVTRKPST